MLVRNAVLRAAFLGVSAIAGSPALAQFATFSSPTDTIVFDPYCLSSPTHLTYEVVLRLNGPQATSGGNIYNEIRPFGYDRQFGISSVGIYEYSHPIDGGILWQTPAVLTPGVWHHIAFCYDGAEQRMYLDGALIGSRPRTGTVFPVCAGQPPAGNAALGWVIRGDGNHYASFLGSIETFRVSSIARYTGAAFTPPPGNLAPDADTLLLYNFEECNSSSATQDDGPLNRVGVLGGEFAPGTRPDLARVCCPADLDDDGDLSNGANPDGGVDINDLLCFLAGFELGNIAADLDDDGDPGAGTPDGGVDINDLLFFLARFESGC